MKAKSTLLLSIIAFVGIVNTIFASNKEAGFPLVTNYDAYTYNADTQNWDIVQDNRGLMYFANGNGVLVYDGNSWELIGLPNKISARALGIDSNGTIYTAGTNEIGYLQPNNRGRLEYVSLIDSLGINEIGIIRDILCTDSCIYFRSAEILIRLNENGFKCWGAKSTFSISFLFNNELYLQDDENGLLKLVNDSLVMAPSGKDFVKKRFYFAQQNKNRVILANRIGGLYIYEPDSFKSKRLKHIVSTANQVLINDFVYSGIITNDDKIILGTNSGGCIVVNDEGEILSTITKETGIQDNNIRSLFIDSNDNLWLALNKGIARCDIAEPIACWNTLKGLEGFITSMINYQENLFIGTLQGLYSLKDNQIKKIPCGISQAWSFLKFQVPRSKKEILLIGAIEGVFVLDNNNLYQIPISSVGYTLQQSKQNPNIVYVGLQSNIGILEYKNGSFEYLGVIPNSGISVRSIVEEENGEIWMATYRNGAVCLIPSEDILKPQKIITYKLESGLPSLKNILLFYLNGKLVFTTENGLYRFDRNSNTFYADTTLGISFPGKEKDVFLIYEDRSGNVYASQLVVNQGSIGVARKQPDGSYTWSSTQYNKIPWMTINMIFLDEHENLWFGGSEGLFKFDHSIHRKFDKPFYTFIRSVKIKNDSCIFYGNYFFEKNGNRSFSTIQNESLKYRIKHQLNSVKFSYSAPEFSNEFELMYKYKLEGYDDYWSAWTTTTVKEYTNLHEGSYQFRVVSKNIYEKESEVSSFEFIILPPWYRTTLAYFAYTVLAILIVLLIVQISIRRLKNANIYLEEQVRIRTNEILQQKEELLAQSEELLAQAEELERNNLELQKLSLVASKTDNGVVIFDVDGTIEWINMGFTRLTGYSLEELKDQRGNSIFDISSREDINHLFKKCVETKESVIYETSFQSKSKENLWLQTTLTPILIAEDEVTKVIAIDSNITEIKKAHQETLDMIDEIVSQAELIQKQNDEIIAKRKDLEKAQKQLIQSEKMASIGVLTAGIAHELNNPINFIFAGINSIMRDLTDIDKVLQVIKNVETTTLQPTEVIQQIISKKNEYDFDDSYNAINQTMTDVMYGAQRTAEIVQGLRNFSRNETEDFIFTNINKIVDGVLLLLKNKYKHHINVIKDLDTSMPDVECKVGKMNQVLMNIISNAIEAIEEKGEIVITSKQVGEYCAISIKDNGMGMSEEVMSKIFDPFFTTKEVGKGTGLGLAITFGIVEEHNGKIDVKSELGKGTEFIVSIPIKQEHFPKPE